eukprot:15365237-Ditylum_brightwellii.AAC.2
MMDMDAMYAQQQQEDKDAEAPEMIKQELRQQCRQKHKQSQKKKQLQYKMIVIMMNMMALKIPPLLLWIMTRTMMYQVKMI